MENGITGLVAAREEMTQQLCFRFWAIFVADAGLCDDDDATPRAMLSRTASAPTIPTAAGSLQLPGFGCLAEVSPRCGEGLVQGSRVRLVNLSARPELNGRFGSLMAWHAQEERWKVRLEDGIVKMFFSSNLQLLNEGPGTSGASHDAGARSPRRASTPPPQGSGVPRPSSLKDDDCGSGSGSFGGPGDATPSRASRKTWRQWAKRDGGEEGYKRGDIRRGLKAVFAPARRAPGDGTRARAEEVLDATPSATPTSSFRRPRSVTPEPSSRRLQASPAVGVTVPRAADPHAPTDVVGEVAMLRQQIERLQQVVANQQGGGASADAASHRVEDAGEAGGTGGVSTPRAAEAGGTGGSFSPRPAKVGAASRSLTPRSWRRASASAADR